jgi:DNA helicase II / ATP-dependent DNA helicase PcrA
MIELNDQQRLAAEHDGGHVLVLAGAGTGKTRTIVARAAHLLRQGIPARRILLLTFTRRAAREMTHRLEQRVGDAATGVTAGTFHHFCLRTMRSLPRAFGVEQATIIDRDDQVSLMKLVRGTLVVRGERKRFPQAGKLVSLLSYARNTNRPLREHLEAHTDLDAETLDKVAHIFAGYRQRKADARYLDYDDILHVFARGLHTDAAVRERVRGLYDHVLVDEMQDTNPLQWLILDGLRDPARLFCVGDDAQSIYAFRGADYRNVHSFADRVEGADVLRLEENYRSTQGILDLASWLLSESRLDFDKHLVAHRGDGEIPRLLDFDSPFDEATWIANDLLSRRETGAEWSDQMILTRTAFGAREMEAELVARDIPYTFIGGTSLMQSAHVKDLLSLCRTALSPHDELAWARYLTLWPGVGDVTAARIVGQLRGCPKPADAFDLIDTQSRLGRTAADGPRAVAEHIDDPAEAVRIAAHVLEPLLRERYDRWDSRRRDFDLLRRLAQRHAALTTFLETYTLDPVHAESRQPGEPRDTVALITVHSAKGTEARVCYVIRAEPGMYPHARSMGDDDAEEEERRILYVAMTRAKDELILTRTLDRWGHTTFHGGYRGPASRGGAEYLLEKVPEGLVVSDSGGSQPSSPWDEDLITPWDRSR